MTQPKNVHEILGEHILADGMAPVMDIEGSKGQYIRDARDGSDFLDMFTMYASCSIGYNHPYILEHRDFLGNMAIYKPALSDMYNVHYADFVKTFERVAIPKELPNLFFIDGGALAVENAIKVGCDWKTRKNMEKGSEVHGTEVIHFKQAFHGRSGYTMSLTNTSDPRKYMYFPKFDWPRITNPMLKFPITDENLAVTKAREEQAISEIKAAIAERGDAIACLIIEPIQSEGGDHHFRQEFFKALRTICDEQDIFLIFDEVQTGMGLTGKMWGYMHTGVVPDAISFAKKAQVGGILVSDRVKEVEKNCFEESSRINSTFGGNFVDMMRFKLTLEVIEKENLVENSAKMGEYLLAKIKGMQEKYPDLVSNARGIGLCCAFDLPNGELRNQFATACYDQKMIILGCGDQSIRFRPHLNVDTETLDKAITICEKSLSNMAVEA